MTISKKLFFIAALAIGTNTLPYDAIILKKEVELISKFANNLPAQESKLSDWLKSKINLTYITSNGKIIDIANTIKTSHKPTLVLQKMAAEDFFKDEKVCLIVGTFCSGVIIGYISCCIDNYIYHNFLNTK